MLGCSAIKAGVAYLACALTVVFAAGIAGKLVTIFGIRNMLASGLVISAAGLYYFTHVSADGTYWNDRRCARHRDRDQRRGLPVPPPDELGRSQNVAWTNGFQWAFWISLAFCAVGFLATVAVIRRVTLPDVEAALATE